MRCRRAAAVLAAGTVLALSGCSGVPSSSAPQIVKQLNVAQPPPEVGIAPEPGADPRSIVSGFLANNASDDPHHTGARAFLTPEEKNRWSDTPQTTVVDSPQIGNFVNGSVTVTGHLVGTMDQNGEYTPSLQGTGNGVGGAPFTMSLGFKQVNGQWRIDTVPNGLVISAVQFAQYYQQRVVYLFDAAEQRIVPQPRYTTLTDPTALATWLLSQLIIQPGPSLSTALPSQPNASQVKVTMGKRLQVEIPGASQLDATTRDDMAAQVALTLDQAAPGAQMEITDGGNPVKIDRVGGPVFAAQQFAPLLNPANSAPALYYIRSGAVLDAAGNPVAGPAGTGGYDLRSVAIATTVSSSRLLVAGVTGAAAKARLLIGQSGSALQPTSVTGDLSRPAWVPNADEVWVGVGPQVYRVSAAGGVQPVQLASAAGSVSGRIIALRFSPEGARVALVVVAADGTSQVWLGTVVRTPSSVRVADLAPISPLGIDVTDVAWNDELKLFAIGHDTRTLDAGVFEVQCDGSLWTDRGINNLPQAPDSITVAENVVAAVSAGGTVWVQRAGSWIGLNAAVTPGTNPVYQE
ncbi:MAG: hypothetical protein EPN43_05115 [Jatrophihabitans sp.]|nr:MAG: hypothetical protein EPN43_05115 [Jatrophihabitans sp.]